jgi:type IV secretion system protein VirB10
MADEKNIGQGESPNNGVHVERDTQKAKGYSKRIIAWGIFGVFALIALITSQAHFGAPNAVQTREKPLRAPMQNDFAAFAALIRNDRANSPAVPAPSKSTAAAPSLKEPEARVIQSRSRLPYQSNQDDAQAAGQLRTMKVQALTAKPIAEGFESNEIKQEAITAPVMRVDSNGRVLDSGTMAALAQGQPDPNGQAKKREFLRGDNGGAAFIPQDYSQNVPLPQQFPYELKAGTVIPGLLISGINSDLPGNVLAQVSENVWDTATGKHVLIPKGTKIIGVYDSEVSYGQRRVLFVWNRLILPNGTSLNIAGSPGIDQAGYSGISGRVNEHLGKMLGAALFASVFIAGAEMIYDKDSQQNSDNKSPSDVAAESTARSILEMGTRLMNKASDIQPTITVRPGKKVGIFVQQDVVFPFPYFE